MTQTTPSIKKMKKKKKNKTKTDLINKFNTTYYVFFKETELLISFYMKFIHILQVKT